MSFDLGNFLLLQMAVGILAALFTLMTSLRRLLARLLHSACRGLHRNVRPGDSGSLAHALPGVPCAYVHSRFFVMRDAPPAPGTRDEFIAAASATDATTQIIEQSDLLERLGGVGALLRYPVTADGAIASVG
jgi:hypothetical protein